MPFTSRPAPDRTPSSAPQVTPPVRPVILGGDLGAYATARAFHEAFGVRSVVIASARVGAVRDSSIIDLRVVPGAGEPDRLEQLLRDLVAERPTQRHLVLASADWLVQALVTLAPALADLPQVVVPYADAATVALASDKSEVMARCARLGVPHPETAVLDVHAPDVVERLEALTYPRVVKVASTTAAHDVSYPGQAKVHVVTGPAEAADLLGRMAGAGLTVPVLVQELLPGGDTAMAAANVFVGRDGVVRFAQLGRVLLEEHTPSALGNSLAQVTVDARQDPAAPEILAQVQRLLLDLGWTGFANVDLMAGADGRLRVLEINPRVGRSGYAVTASGYNVAAMYVAEYGVANDGVPDDDAAPDDAARPAVLGSREHLFTVVPLILLRLLARDRWAQVRRLRRAGKVTNPLYYRAERHPRRWLYIAVAMVNQARKLLRFHPASRVRAFVR